MITLYQFYRAWGLPNASPFCMKVETYLRMTNLPYETKFINNPQQAPKGKLPYIQIDGVNYPDSELIIDELKKRYGDALDKDLTEEQRALAVLLDNTFCERMYWVVVYMRWQNDAGWAVVKEGYFGKLPALPKLFVPSIIRKKMLKALYLQGNGRHSTEEIIRLGCKTMDALACILGDKPYFLGDKPTSIDATSFAFIANTLMSPINDALKQHALQFDTVTAYCSRMWDEYYADFPKSAMQGRNEAAIRCYEKAGFEASTYSEDSDYLVMIKTTHQSMTPISIKNAPHYSWGNACDGWWLKKDGSFNVISEKMPSGTSEKKHYHKFVEQFFYCLQGRLLIQFSDKKIMLSEHEGCVIPAGEHHKVMNPTDEEIHFLVISSPNTHNDRIDLE